jgi:hypothetical protein
MTERASDAAAAWLLTPGAVRERAGQLLRLAEADALSHFVYRADCLPVLIDYVLEIIHRNYPTLAIPFHSRWRHFAVGGRDRWGALRQALAGESAAEIARTRFDLAVTSVLIDAGAGPRWQYCEAPGERFARSEGLAVASVHLFRAGLFSGDPRRPLRAGAAGLRAIDAARLAAGLQVTQDNPLTGLDGRAALLRRLGEALAGQPELFGEDARVGRLFDHLLGQAVRGALPAAAILAAVLRGFGSIWPGREVLAGVNLGDTWRHSAIRSDDASHGLVPFHKLSQWLSYSLIEPLEEAGIRVTGCDALTGLAEYRNGGLLIDGGVLVPRDAGLLGTPLAVGSEPVVEWRGLTVALLDRIAEGVRTRLGRDAESMPLVKVLEGGTWSAGRRIARENRPDGAPPLAIVSDGTVF